MGIKSLINTYFTYIKPSFSNAVHQNCIADAQFNLSAIVKECTSVNELLNFYHSYLINNLDYEEVFPLSNEKNQVYLFGTPNDISKEIIENFPSTIDSSYVHILSCGNDLVIMIIRDYGHATSIKIVKNQNEIDVDYFIPKVIDPEMIKKLPGYNRMNLNNHLGWATGNFRGTIADLFKFIEKIPTDQDFKRQM